MKKIQFVAIFFMIIFLSAMNVQASSTPKVVESNLSLSTDQITIGDTITLTAKTQKHGSDYAIKWDGASALETYKDESTGLYVSNATFTPEQPGTYTITYEIKMYTGNGKLKFISSASKTIEVISDVKEVMGLEVKNINAFPNYDANETIEGYTVIGELNVLWNDNTSTLYRTVSYFFSLNETSREISLTVMIDGMEYTFPVTISIQH